MKTAVNLVKSIKISVHGLTGSCSGVTSPSGGLLDCITRRQVSQLATNDCTWADKPVIDTWLLNIAFFCQLRHMLLLHVLHQLGVHNSSYLQNEIARTDHLLFPGLSKSIHKITHLHHIQLGIGPIELLPNWSLLHTVHVCLEDILLVLHARKHLKILFLV